MERATHHAVAGHWPEDETVDAMVLTYDERYRRRHRVTTMAGRDVLIDLPAAVPMAEGDAVRLDDGHGWLAIRAAPEPIAEIRADGPEHLARIAWHIGNRHLAAQIVGGAILIRPDHVIAAMVTGLGGRVSEVERPFQPEGGAYAAHGHAHAHDHDHGHDHGKSAGDTGHGHSVGSHRRGEGHAG